MNVLHPVSACTAPKGCVFHVRYPFRLRERTGAIVKVPKGAHVVRDPGLAGSVYDAETNTLHVGQVQP